MKTAGMWTASVAAVVAGSFLAAGLAAAEGGKVRQDNGSAYGATPRTGVASAKAVQQRDRLRDGSCQTTGIQQRDRLRDGSCKTTGIQQRDRLRDGSCQTR